MSEPITENEVLEVLRENPMICTRAMIKKLRPDDFEHGTGDAYRAHLDSLKPLLMSMWSRGIIVSSKTQCCTFNLKQWQLA
ncbi:hypothetical protein TALC_01500 [Thermoplasmatales archaeon BRNA1]|nr:hypothetical protein TALC_01500 [Thermoplasmatales archaeon BRNA1]